MIPQKIGGGHKLQTYNEKNGEYDDRNDTSKTTEELKKQVTVEIPKEQPTVVKAYDSREDFKNLTDKVETKKTRKPPKETFKEKPPVRQNFIDKYGFAGDAMYRLERIKWQDRKNAWDRKMENDRQSRILLRDYETEPIKTKQDVIDFTKRQIGLDLKNESGFLNSKRKSLYTEIPNEQKNVLIPLLKRYGVDAEQHGNGNNYWLHIRN